MLLSDKRVRNIIREEILKKSRNRRRMNEASTDPERRWKKITSMLGVSEKPSKSQYNRAWDRFIENHYKRMKEEQPKVSELFSDKDVSAALSKFGGAYDTDDEEEKIFMFLIKYKNVQGRSAGGMKKKEKEEAGEEEETETVESSETIDLGQGANWDNAVKLNVDAQGRIILDDQFKNLVGGIVDSLDGSVSLQNLKDVTKVVKKLKGKKVVNPVSEDEVDALKWLHRKYKAAEGGDTIAGDVEDYIEDADLQDNAEYVKQVFARFVNESRSSKSKTRAVIQELVKRHIRQLNEDQPASVQDRFSTAKVVDAVPAGDTTVTSGGTGEAGGSKLAKAKALFDKKLKGKTGDVKWMKNHPTNPAGDGKYHPATMVSLDTVDPILVTVKWKDGGKIQTKTPFKAEYIKKSGGKASGSGKSGKYTTWDKKWPLEKYHKGDKVKELQVALQKHKKDLKDDTFFGPGTESALASHPVNKDKKKVVDEELFKSIVGWEGEGEVAAVATDSLSADGRGGKGKVKVKGGPHYKFRQGKWDKRAHEIIINPKGTSQKLFNEYLKGKVKDADLEGQEERKVDKIRIIFKDVAAADNAAEHGVSEAEFKTSEIRTGRGVGAKANVRLNARVAWKALAHANLLSKVPEQ